MTADRIEHRARFDYIRYANVWEDADVLCAALEPRPGKRILSIASGGDNSFALAAEGAEVVAVDLSPAQLAMTELKRAAILELEHDDLLRFLGVTPQRDRERTYTRLSQSLPASSRAFWDAHPAEIERGVIHAGKFERYFRTFRRYVVPLFHRRSTVQLLLAEKSEADRRAFYHEVWDNWRWRAVFKIFFSRRVMGRMGRDPEFFRYVEGDVAGRILGRAEYAFTVLPTHDNPYLRYIFTGEFAGALPRYLEPERYPTLRDGMSRLMTIQGGADEVARMHGPFDGFNLSDIFEYLDAPTCAAVYESLLSCARAGALLAYWNMLVPRRRPDHLAGRVRSLDDRARELLRRDRAFFYSAFVLEQAR